jgi:hypothetical protein
MAVGVESQSIRWLWVEFGSSDTMSTETLARESVDHPEKSKHLLEPGDINAWLDALTSEVRLVEQLRTRLLDRPAVVADDPVVQQVLSGIDLTEAEGFDKVGAEILYSWIKPAEYGARFAEVSVLVARFQIPFDLRCLLDEARQCYALGQFSAVQSLSRTILETAVNDIAVRTGKLPQAAVEKDRFEEYPLKERIRLVADGSAEQIYQHHRDLGKVVHGLSASATNGALGSLTRTMGFVQYLYERHKVRVKSGNN